VTGLNSNSHEWHARLKKFKDIMLCEACGLEQLTVNDSRMVCGIRRRRRICNACGNRTTTYEISSEDFEKMIKKEEQKG
jgi:transcriptional regulator NrdR family protein